MISLGSFVLAVAPCGEDATPCSEIVSRNRACREVAFALDKLDALNVL